VRCRPRPGIDPRLRVGYLHAVIENAPTFAVTMMMPLSIPEAERLCM
jgi:hypothetical protein